MFLQKSLFRARNMALIRNCNIIGSTQQRDYFSVFEKIKDRFNIPMRHIKSFVEPDGQNY